MGDQVRVWPGQIWKATDKRRGYSIRVVAFEPSMASETRVNCINLKTGKTTTPKLSRFCRHGGYRLIEDVNPTPLVQQPPAAPVPRSDAVKAPDKLFAVVCSDGKVCQHSGSGVTAFQYFDEIHEDLEEAKRICKNKADPFWKGCTKNPHVVVEYVKGKTWRMES